MERELLKKLQREEALSIEETLRLDAELEAESPTPEWLSSLGDATPSLAWRSELNQQLRRHAQRRRHARWFTWGSSLAAGAAACLAFVALFANPKAPQVPSTTVATNERQEGAFVRAHRDAEVQTTLGVSLPAESGSSPYDWSQLDSL